MAYQIILSAKVVWQGDGAGGMSQQAGYQSIGQDNLFGANGGLVQVPGGDAPTAANITAAMATAAANVAAGLTTAALLAQIQGWASGRG